MASFTKHGDGWRAHVYVEGKRKTRVFDRLEKAKKWARDTERSLDTIKRVGLTFSQAIQKFEPEHKRSAKWNENTFARLLDHFKDVPLASIGKPEIAGWRDKRLKTVSGSTVTREANLLRRLFTLARIEWEVIVHNPFEGVRLPDHNPARQAMWTWPLIRRVLRSGRQGKTGETVAAFRVALATGMRLSEVLAAELDGKVARLQRDKTTNAPVKIPLTGRGIRAIKAAPEFTVGANEASTLFSKLLKELLIEGLTFHDGRASALTWLSRRVDVMTLARISRHKDLRILQETYYRETAEQIAERI